MQTTCFGPNEIDVVSIVHIAGFQKFNNQSHWSIGIFQIPNFEVMETIRHQEQTLAVSTILIHELIRSTGIFYF